MKKVFLFIVVSALATISIKAQITGESQDSLRKDAVKIFIDCEFCDMDHIRREIPYINYVRDVKDAQVYMRETMQMTGSGGAEYSYFFSGQGKFSGMEDTLTYATRPDDTMENQRQGRTNTIKMGLVRYVARTSISKDILIGYMGFGGQQGEEEQVSDKWNNWVFSIETRPNLQRTQTVKEESFVNSFSATKVTPKWKIESDFNHRYSKSKYDFGYTKYTAIARQMSLNNLIVKSISQHWSVGGKLNLLSSTYKNANFNAEIYPSIEYNLYPYAESTHRQLRFLYGIGLSMNQYIDTTIYGKTEENLIKHQLQIAYEVKEKWGSVNVSLEGSNYFNDFKKNRIEMNGSVNIRIIKGLSLNIHGSIAKINDQIYIPADGPTDEEILLRLQEQATDFSIITGVGFTYTFGSIFNNVVNPRFGNGSKFGGSGGMMMFGF